MNAERKHEAIARLLWLVDNEMSNLPQKEEGIDSDQSWIDEYNREMEDAFAIVSKMYDDALVELRAQRLTKEYRKENPTASYDAVMSHYRREVKRVLAAEKN